MVSLVVANLATSASAVSSSRVGSTRSTVGRLVVTAWRWRVRRTALPCFVSVSLHPADPSLRLVTIGLDGVTTMLPKPP